VLKYKVLKSVLSVQSTDLLSPKRVDCDKKEERSVQILYHTKD